MKSLEEKLRATERVFIPYVMAGDNESGLAGLQGTIDLLSGAGATAIEVGVPFSDPVADGPVIEQAGIRSLKRGTSLAEIIATLKSVRTDTPLVLMTYFNPLFQYGITKFVTALAGTAVKGLIVPDLPLENEKYVRPALEAAGADIALIRMVSLTDTIERQRQLVEGAEGFIYAVAINGVTGTEHKYTADLDQHLSELSGLTDVPVVTGFGVSTQADVDRFNRVSSGVVVGSKIVEDLHEGKADEVVEFIKAATK